MILVFGGTTEGRLAAKTLDEAGTPFYYFTRGDMQRVEGKHLLPVNGALDREAMMHFCRENAIRCIVDAAHPFASQLHETVDEVAAQLCLPVIRLERSYTSRDVAGIIWCESFDDALVKLNEYGVKSLLALTGVQTISRLRPFWSKNHCVFRILDREESWQKAAAAGFPSDCLIAYSPDDKLEDVIDTCGADAIITKESGESGGFESKLETARKCGIKFFAVQRPAMPSRFITVTGCHGLRREVEKNCPGFYKLRSGFTTGACATAAAKAACVALITGEAPDEIIFSLPDGEEMVMAIEGVTIDDRKATAMVVKDAGDDPDVTNGCRISVTVALVDEPDIKFIAGEGVGTVTLPGLGLKPGEAAINPVPRKMIKHELRELYPDGGLEVTVSVEGGAELAQRTFNPKLGIVGGVSIIGTSGIVRPFSNEAFVESLRREMEVARAIGCRHIVVNSGAKSERFVKALYPELIPQAFIHYGNAIGETMAIASQLGVERLTIGIMIGKAVKLAEGNTDTHSKNVTINHDFLAGVAREAGCSEAAVETIGGVKLARELWSSLSEPDARLFFSRITELCHRVCRSIYSVGALETLLITDDGKIPYRINEFGD